METCEATMATLRIDLAAMADNYLSIANRVAPAAAGAVVKADAYGLGATEVCAALSTAGCRHFFVAHLGEAGRLASLARSGRSIFVLNGLPVGAEEKCAEIGAIPVLNSIDQIERWNRYAKAEGRQLPAALQVDSGMSRLGLSAAEVDRVVADANVLSHIDLVLLMSHLACGDDASNPFNDEQSSIFAMIADRLGRPPLSLDNSAGCFLDRPHLDLVRPGIALYGGNPGSGVNPMKPVVSLEAQIIQVRAVPAGTRVGYGLTHQFDRPGKVATIGIGYADGWPRHLGGKGCAFIAGRRVAIIGRVSMDSITLDVTDVPPEHLYPGAPVEMLGVHQTIDDVAEDAGTISYEILTRLGRRYRREFPGLPCSPCQEGAAI